MFLRILFILIAFITSINFVKAEEYLLTVTPVSKFSTSNKNVYEGDEIFFKVEKDTKIIKKDAIISGIITSYEENGIYGKNAKIIISNFKTQDNRKISGSIYLTGGEHKVFQEFLEVDNTFNALILLFGFCVRGSEINLEPDNDSLEFFTEG